MSGCLSGCLNSLSWCWSSLFRCTDCRLSNCRDFCLADDYTSVLGRNFHVLGHNFQALAANFEVLGHNSQVWVPNFQVMDPTSLPPPIRSASEMMSVISARSITNFDIVSATEFADVCVGAVRNYHQGRFLSTHFSAIVWHRAKWNKSTRILN